jgi:sarcosine oxidase subunit alpha
LTEDLRDLPAGRRRGQSLGDPLTIDFEGEPVRAYPGESVAVALFASHITTLARSSKYHRPRGFFCLDGHCASCYLRIDGAPNRRACMTPVRAGLRCERQNAFPSVDVDLLMAADWLFPEGMDHHTLMTGTRVGNQLFLKLVRQMGGSGTLPDAAPASLPSVRDQVVDLCIVGGGPAGLAAARSAAEAAPALRVVLYDEQAQAGGSLLSEPGGTARADSLVEAARRAGAMVESQAAAIAFYPEDSVEGRPPGVLAVVTPTGLVRVSARRTLYATGAYDQNLPFMDNDRPGVISARACGRLAFHHGVRPVRAGKRVVILDAAPYAQRLAAGLAAAGVETALVDTRRQQVLAARGTKSARGVEVAARNARGGASSRTATSTTGATATVKGDLVAVAALPAPASELARQQGARVTLVPEAGGFVVAIDAHFASSAPDVYACGDVTGAMGPEAALEAGARAGRAAVEALT